MMSLSICSCRFLVCSCCRFESNGFGFCCVEEYDVSAVTCDISVADVVLCS